MWKTFSVITILWLVLSVDVYAQIPRMARVTGERAVMRQTPSDDGHKEKEITKGTTVKVLDEELPWYVVRVGDRVGWMRADLLQFVSATETAEFSKSRGKEIRSSGTPPSARTYFRGSRGGCYYLSSSGRKVYVDRSLCN